MEIILDTNTGLLSDVSSKNGLIPLINGPINVSKESKCTRLRHSDQEMYYILEAWYGDDEMKITWKMRPNGLVDLEVKYRPEANSSYEGITFDYSNEDIDKISWMGDGPYRVWKNRRKGVNLGVWEKEYNNTITGYSGFTYPEFKGYYSNLYWAEFSSDKSAAGFKVFSRSSDVFLRILTPEEAPDPANTTVLHPEGDISFLHEIPAIGTKFKKPEELGPQSSGHTFLPDLLEDGFLVISLTFDFR